jgi:hypothetical protein
MSFDLQEFIKNTVLPNQTTSEVFGLGHSMGGKALMVLALNNVSFCFFFGIFPGDGLQY